MELPKHIQDKLAQFQGFQNQLQMIAIQKQQMILQSADIENALSELEKITDERIYEAVGPILIESEKEKSKKRLKENKETMDTRIKILEKQEEKLSTKLKELGAELQTLLKGTGIGAG